MSSMDYELDLSGLKITIDPVKALEPVYRVMQRLSVRESGTIFLAEDRNQREYAVKVKKIFYKNARLRREGLILERLYSADPLGFPRVFNYMLVQGHEFLVMHRMGRSMQDLLQAVPSGRLSKKSVLMFGIQAIKWLQIMHQNHILHRDLRPSNFTISFHGREGIISVVGFGISVTVDDWGTYDPNGPSAFCGTVPFAPNEALAEKKPTRAGDLESLLYTIVALCTGELPFSPPSTENSVHDTVLEHIAQRRERSVGELCLDFPDLARFTIMVLSLERRDEPNYSALLQELERVLVQNGYKNDGIFE